MRIEVVFVVGVFLALVGLPVGVWIFVGSGLGPVGS